MTGPARVLIVANRTAATDSLLEAVRRRADAGPAEFHLLVPATPRGLHRVVDPEVAGRQEATEQLELALELLRMATGSEVSGHVGDAEPLAAISDTRHEREVDEIIISTLPRRLSRWMHLDLPSKIRGLGLPATHVEARREPVEASGEAAA
ncbi:MAG: hypothetical protein QOD24_3838 [Solirubrobacteraceae bacterium]|nr:hypothetical protein [Solirubrobacteraceae bacterium]